MNANELNKVIAGRTITSVEDGRTKGWVVIYLSGDEENLDFRAEGDDRVFLTVKVDRPPQTDEEEHFSQFALHCGVDGWSYNIRDPRLLEESHRCGYVVDRTLSPYKLCGKPAQYEHNYTQSFTDHDPTHLEIEYYDPSHYWRCGEHEIKIESIADAPLGCEFHSSDPCEGDEGEGVWMVTFPSGHFRVACGECARLIDFGDKELHLRVVSALVEDDEFPEFPEDL